MDFPVICNTGKLYLTHGNVIPKISVIFTRGWLDNWRQIAARVPPAVVRVNDEHLSQYYKYRVTIVDDVTI
jgi:hypothetical protein